MSPSNPGTEKRCFTYWLRPPNWHPPDSPARLPGPAIAVRVPCRRSSLIPFVAAGLFILLAFEAAAQTAVIEEEVRSIKTYPFSDPDPNPILIRDPRLYPYHAFDGYSHEGRSQPWKVVRLENDFIEVYVLPEVGGKVWGAVEKSTGAEFIYRNEVLKFRNIALRGPWTSGGIEFNFGVIGHTPATATPVDYALVRHDAGGVTCVVGAMDLPSRTQWRVQIHLPADRAYFETRTLWYNPTPVLQSYYNWMTGAAFARDDLEVIFPGSRYLKHSGEAKPWPKDAEGRDLSRYDNNRFGGHKSYHVVGEYTDFFGGYYHDAGYGFGHWAPYGEMPGQKLWLWALSRAGGIWEDLLTDTDGQYVEFQAGRLLVQYAPGEHANPIRQDGFEPYRTDRWNERWFPIKGIGGMSTASGRGVMHVARKDDLLEVGINAFEPVSGTLEVVAAGRSLFRRPLDLQPMEVLNTTIPLRGAADYEVTVPELGLRYVSPRDQLKLKRPFEANAAGVAAMSDTDRRLARGMESLKARQYGAARAEFDAILAEYPWHREALMAMADLQFRSALYADGGETIRKVLQFGTYDARANYLAGIIYRAAGDLTNAKESFGWAARSMACRSAANTQIAEIALQEGDPHRAVRYAERALDYDQYGINALQVLAIAARIGGQTEAARAARERLLAIDPLHHFANFERYLLDHSDDALARFKALIRGEFPEQTYLELAIGYHSRGLDDVAVEILSLRAEERNPLIGLWLAYLLRDSDSEASGRLVSDAVAWSPAFVFPFRRETIAVLEWASAQNTDWKLGYYLALNFWAVDRTDEAARLLDGAGTKPDYGPFYVARAHLLRETAGRDPEADLRRGVQFDEAHWQTWLHLVRYLEDQERWSDAEALARRAAARFPGNFNLDLTHARALLFAGHLDDCADILDRVQVLPSEMGRTSRQLYEWVHVKRALALIRSADFQGAVSDLQQSLKWPEHLGQGRPYDPEERLQHFLLAYVHRRLGDLSTAGRHEGKLIECAPKRTANGFAAQVLAHRLLTELGRGAEADELLRGLSVPAEAGDPGARWVLARVQADGATLEELKRDHPGFFDSFSFRLLDEALDITNGGL